MGRDDDDPVCDVSVVVPFDDDEERVGALSRRVAAHLRQLDIRFEILAVAEDSWDNSVAVLSLLRAQVPELRVLTSGHAHGFSVGARVARGCALWLLDAKHADTPLAPFSWAYARVHAGSDLVAVTGRFFVCRRTRVWRCLDGIRGRGDTFARRFLRRARGNGITVETLPTAPRRTAYARLLGSLTRGRVFGLLR